MASDTFDGAAHTILSSHDPNWVGTAGATESASIAELDGAGNVRDQEMDTFNHIWVGYSGSFASKSEIVVASSFTGQAGSEIGPTIHTTAAAEGYAVHLRNTGGATTNEVDIEKNGSFFERITFINAFQIAGLRITAEKNTANQIEVTLDDGTTRETQTSTVDETPLTGGIAGFHLYQAGNPAIALAEWNDGVIVPVLLFPSTDTITTSSAVTRVTSDTGEGILFCYLSTSVTPPSPTDLKNGTGAVFFDLITSPVAGVNSFYLNGLTGGTVYYSHFIQNDGTNDSAIVSTAAWGTVPTLSNPSASPNETVGSQGNTVDLAIDTDGSSGTVYWYLSTSASAPSVPDLKSGMGAVSSGHAVVVGSGTQHFVKVGSLEEKQTYYVYFLHTLAGTDSNILAGTPFTVPTDSPTLSNGTGTATGKTTATIQVDTTRMVGTAYYVVSQSSSPPTGPRIKEGQDHTGSTADASGSNPVVANPQEWSVSGLVENTVYYAHFYQEDGEGDPSNVVTSKEFTPGISVRQIDGFSPANPTPGETVTVFLSGPWGPSGKTALYHGHPLTLTSQSSTQVQFVYPSLHTDLAFNDVRYRQPYIFTLSDDGTGVTEILTGFEPVGFDLVIISSIHATGIFADDTDVAIGDDALGHYTSGAGDLPLTPDGILDGITVHAVFEYWIFDVSAGSWTAPANEHFYAVVESTSLPSPGPFYDGVAIPPFQYSTVFNDLEADITNYGLVQGTLPAGLSLNTTTGELTGIPTGGFQQPTGLMIQATDSDGNTAVTPAHGIIVYAAPSWASTPGNQNWSVGTPVSLDLSFFLDNGGPATNWSLLAGTLPDGLTLDPSTGHISGTPAASGIFSGLQFRAMNPAGHGDGGSFSINVSSAAPGCIMSLFSLPWKMLQVTGLFWLLGVIRFHFGTYLSSQI